MSFKLLRVSCSLICAVFFYVRCMFPLKLSYVHPLYGICVVLFLCVVKKRRGFCYKGYNDDGFACLSIEFLQSLVSSVRVRLSCEWSSGM